MHGVRGVGGIGKQPGRARDADADELGRPVGPDPHQLRREIGIRGRGGGIEGNARCTEHTNRLSKRPGGVDQQVVAQLEHRLIKLATRRRRPSGREHRYFRVVDKKIAGLLRPRRVRGQRTVALAGIRQSGAVQVPGVSPFGGPGLRLRPAVLTQHKVSDARFTGKFTGVLQPVIEPAQQECICVEQCLGAELGHSRPIAPG